MLLAAAGAGTAPGGSATRSRRRARVPTTRRASLAGHGPGTRAAPTSRTRTARWGGHHEGRGQAGRHPPLGACTGGHKEKRGRSLTNPPHGVVLLLLALRVCMMVAPLPACSRTSLPSSPSRCPAATPTPHRPSSPAPARYHPAPTAHRCHAPLPRLTDPSASC